MFFCSLRLIFSSPWALKYKVSLLSLILVCLPVTFETDVQLNFILGLKTGLKYHHNESGRQVKLIKNVF